MRASIATVIVSKITALRFATLSRAIPIVMLACVTACDVAALPNDGAMDDSPTTPLVTGTASSAPTQAPPEQQPTSNNNNGNSGNAPQDQGTALTAPTTPPVWPIVPVGATCTTDSDCGPGACNYDNKCVEAQSCKIQNGGDTCGAGQAADPDAAHESCCGSVALPGKTVAIDKYAITAGRMRAFIDQTAGDVQDWVAAHRTQTAQIPDGLVPYLPTGLDTPTLSVKECNQADGNCDQNDPSQFPTVTQSFGVHDYLGNEVFMRDRPGVGTGQGCWIGSDDGDVGHPTYYWDDATQTNQYGSQPRAYSQDVLDAKALNCTPEILFAAFCAWDGGRLPTIDELGGTDGAWGPADLPWGNAPDFRDTVHGAGDPARIQYGYAATDPCGDGSPCFLVPSYDGNGLNPAAWTLNTSNFNPFPSSPDPWEARYMFPLPADIYTNDQAWAVAEPGRMRNDFRYIGPNPTDGYYDLAGNIMQAAAPDGTFDDANHNSWPTSQWIGGSFEGHWVARGSGEQSIFTKYGKEGARCARDI